MLTIKCTYPTPDSARENCGPRERALAVFRYLMDLEPEEAAKHPRFHLIVNAFQQQSIMALRRVSAAMDEVAAATGVRPNVIAVCEPLEPLEPELTSTRDFILPEL